MDADRTGDESPQQAGTTGPFGGRLALSGALLVAIGLSILAITISVRYDRAGKTWGRLLAIPFVFFLPGYALVSGAFPGAEPSDDSGDWLGTLERLALSVGITVAVLPIVGIGLLWVGVGVTYQSVIVTLSTITVGGSIVAGVRRARLPQVDRTRPTPLSVTHPRDWSGVAELAVNVTLAMSVILAVATIGYAMAYSQSGEVGPEFYVLSPDGEGAFVASDYPTESAVGENLTLGIGITQDDATAAEYTVVVQLEQVERGANDPAVIERVELTRVTFALGPGETVEQPVTVSPSLEGEELRLSFLLYDGPVAENPDRESADLHLHLWIDVTSNQ